ncbi:MAG: hypothetical protein IAE91_11405 [Ignavibacteriaceae bacterium]|nr:hypothetical protein [Ignavibacteriaceae bacterium]
MSGIEIRKIESKKEITQFIKFPWKIYKDYPNWVPPLIFDKEKMLDKSKNPFFEHGEADYFMAYKNGEIVGRIAAVKNDLHNSTHNDKVGFFGFFECINDQEVCNLLLDTAKDWLKKKGFDTMRGPASFSSNDEWGLLIRNFDDPPNLLMPYNPPYYQTLLENYGLFKVQDLYAYQILYHLIQKVDKIKRVTNIARERFGLTIRTIDFTKFDEELDRIKILYNKTWQPNWGFVPLTEKEIDYMAGDLKQLAIPELIIFAELDGVPVGFALPIIDYNYIFKQMNGKLFPFGWLKMLTQKKNIKRCRILILGVVPEHQKKGFDAVLYEEIIQRGHKLGIDEGEASWVLEDNEMMNRSAQMMNAERYKTYRVYDIQI